MNNKTKQLEALHVYVQKAPKWELPSLRNQCVQMIKMIDARLYNKPMPKQRLSLYQRLCIWLRHRKDKKK